MIKILSPKIIRKIWGGKKLEEMKSLISSAGEPIGETLEIYDESLPYLAKFIDTSDELSIQVHPGDEYARIHENSSGKTECWVILEAAKGAGVYLGLKPNITKDILEKSLKEKKAINELLNFYPVKRGDFFYVTAGSIHAIGRDITLAEVQQNSGITYRLWDWDRLDDQGVSRELNIDKSLAVINFEAEFNTSNFFRLRNNLFSDNGLIELCDHPDFKLSILNIKKDEVFEIDFSKNKRPYSLLNLEGGKKVNEVAIRSYEAITLYDENKLSIKFNENGSILIIS